METVKGSGRQASIVGWRDVCHDRRAAARILVKNLLESLHERLFHASAILTIGSLTPGLLTFSVPAIRTRISPNGPLLLYSCRMMRQGLPTATTFAGKSRVTTLPAPTTVFAPIVTPGQTTARPPSQTPSSIETGRAYSIPERRAFASTGCVAV